MGRDLQKPYSRSDYASALALNAAVKPFNLAVLFGVLAVGVFLIDAPIALTLAFALAVYAAACAVSFFDDDEAEKVLARERGERRAALEGRSPRVDPRMLAPEIRTHLAAAHDREARIRQAIEGTDLPYTEVLDEVDGFVRLMERTAGRAQLLYDALADNPPERVEQRLHEVKREGDPTRRELVEALTHQLHVQRRMHGQLVRFFDEMERVVIEMDTIRGQLLSVSASTDEQTRKELAGEVRSLREDMGALAEGMEEAYRP
jgi:hypothetical protein